MYAWPAAALLVLLVIALWASVLLAFLRPLRARWREPVFRHPLLVLESDDWGAGPLTQTEALGEIAVALQEFRDGSGRHPVMTLGMIFEVPDCDRMAREQLAFYRACNLDNDVFSGLRQAIRSGLDARVFSAQLHGQCHYWPSALMQAATRDRQVRTWLMGPGLPHTESLPSHLQTRWVDASELPSRELDATEIALAAAREAASYRKVFGGNPQVAVATTFVWNGDVEQAWKEAGVEVVITPGRRATGRDARGEPACVDRLILTGERSAAGQCYLVRDVYFEPALGHSPQRLVDGLVERTRQGRACLVEIHRFNFLSQPNQSLEALRAGIRASLMRCPNLRFTTPLELAQAIRQENSALLERAFNRRVHAWLARLHEIPHFRRASTFTGLVIPLRFLERAV